MGNEKKALIFKIIFNEQVGACFRVDSNARTGFAEKYGVRQGCTVTQ